ncbi:MAG: hypothetical protein GY856_11445 [bacterium]|nr:hypothetical protein [bacterium]
MSRSLAQRPHSGTWKPTAAEPAFRPRTALGQELWKLRMRIVASGEPLPDEDQIEDEVDRRRGGIGLRDQ